MSKRNTVFFSLPEAYIQKIEDLAQDGESIGLCAKRLLIGLLGGETVSPTPSPHLEEQLLNLQQQLMNLEELVTASPTATADNPKLEKRLNQLNERIEAIEDIGVEDELSALEERMTEAVFKLNERIEALEQSGTPAHPTQQTEPPLSDMEKLTAQAKPDGLTCSELARLLGKSPSAVTRWKEREGGIDPSGQYQWDGIDRWFPFP